MDFSEYMNDLERDFCIWLNKNPKIIKESLDKTLYNYDYIKITYVELIESNKRFFCHVKYCALDVAVSPYLETPKEFLRVKKLERICKQ